MKHIVSVALMILWMIVATDLSYWAAHPDMEVTQMMALGMCAIIALLSGATFIEFHGL